MDLIAILSSQFGLDTEKAQGLAGAVLGKLEEQVGQKLGGADAAALRSKLPELDGWKSKVPALEGGGVAAGLLGGAAALGGGLFGGSSPLGGAGGLLGGSSGGLDAGALVQLAVKAGLGAGAAEKLLPVLVSFLKTRLDPNLLAKVLSAVPGLEKLAGGSTAGGLMGGLGGILG